MVNSQKFEHPGQEQREFNDFYNGTYDVGFRKLPKMYERTWIQSFDKRFALILFISLRSSKSLIFNKLSEIVNK